MEVDKWVDGEWVKTTLPDYIDHSEKYKRLNSEEKVIAAFKEGKWNSNPDIRVTLQAIGKVTGEGKAIEFAVMRLVGKKLLFQIDSGGKRTFSINPFKPIWGCFPKNLKDYKELIK